MAKLYEILAVERDLEKSAKEEIGRVTSLFSQDGLLKGQVISSHPILEGEPELPPEITNLAHTVKGELEKLREVVGSFVDVTVQKEASNTRASETIILDEKDFIAGLPATALLNLESRLKDIRKAYEAIPVIDMTERWNYNADQGCFVSEVRERIRTKKTLRNHVLYQATKEHPAQVQVIQEDVPAYKIETVISSGMITPAEKEQLLARIDKLQAAVTKARTRANDVEIVDVKVADKIFDYIHTGAV